MRFLLDGALAQEIPHILFSGQGTVTLVAKLRFMPFFGRFHSANGDIGAGHPVPPAIEPAANCIFEDRRFRAEVAQFFFPTLCVAFLGLRHSDQDSFAFFVLLAGRQIAVRLRRLDFRPPIALDHLNRLLPARRSLGGGGSIFWFVRWIAGLHLAQSGAAVADLGVICCAVITIATDPIINPAPRSVRMVKLSPAKAVPSRTATTGLM